MDVRERLATLGLEQYAEAFEQNAVNEQDLPHLTPEDLTALGVIAVGTGGGYSSP